VALYPDYATLAELKAFVRIDSSDTSDDTWLAYALTAASRAVDEVTSRQFGLNGSAVARYYTPRVSRTLGRWVADIDDLMTTSGQLVKADLNFDGTYETSYTDFRMWPYNAAGDQLAWTRIVFGLTANLLPYPGCLEVTANWGWTSVPSTVKDATLLQASRFYKRRDAPFGIAGSPQLGSEMRLLAKADPDVVVMLKPYTRQAYV
jgi:hypothetical protein